MSGIMAGWGEFTAAVGLFFLSHALLPRPGVRGPAVALLGERGFTVAYSILSFGVLAWLIVAAGRAPFVELWSFAPWQLWVANLVMPFVCLLLAYGVGAPNPLSFGGARNAAFDPDRPGIAGAVRHPVAMALGLWAASHLAPNGDLAHALLFGSFAGFAALGMAMIDRRKCSQLGEAEWRRLSARTSFWPFAALLAGRWRPSGGEFPQSRLVIAAALYAGLLLSHGWVIGISPFPVLG